MHCIITLLTAQCNTLGSKFQCNESLILLLSQFCFDCRWNHHHCHHSYHHHHHLGNVSVGVTEVNINSPGPEPKQCNESLILSNFSLHCIVLYYSILAAQCNALGANCCAMNHWCCCWPSFALIVGGVQPLIAINGLC